MNLKNYKDYAAFDYVSFENKDYKLGDVVINKENEIGVIIQTHEDGDFRTDMFGNSCSSEVRLASFTEIKKFRPNIKNEGNFGVKYVCNQIREAMSTLGTKGSLKDGLAELEYALEKLEKYC